jgi:hypothetical protein
MRRGSYFPPLVYKYGQLAINIVYFDTGLMAIQDKSQEN